MNPKDIKSGCAVTASAMGDALSDASSRNGSSNDERVFTQEEVNELIKKRLDRQIKSLLSKYNLSSVDDLDSLVLLAKEVEKTFNKVKSTSNDTNTTTLSDSEINRSNNNNNMNTNNKVIQLEEKVDEDTLLVEEILKDIVDRDYISISYLVRAYSIGFVKAGKYIKYLTDKGFVGESVPPKGNVVFKEKVKTFLASGEIAMIKEHVNKPMNESRSNETEEEHIKSIDEMIQNNFTKILLLFKSAEFGGAHSMSYEFRWPLDVCNRATEYLLAAGIFNLYSSTTKGYKINKKEIMSYINHTKEFDVKKFEPKIHSIKKQNQILRVVKEQRLELEELLIKTINLNSKTNDIRLVEEINSLVILIKKAILFTDHILSPTDNHKDDEIETLINDVAKLNVEYLKLLKQC